MKNRRLSHAAHNNSLNRSSGSVFLKMNDAAEVERIRTAGHVIVIRPLLFV